MTKISPTDLKQPGYIFTRHDLRVPAGIPFDALLDPAFWSEAASRLRKDDEVRAVSADGAFDALLAVDEVETRQSAGWAQMRVLACWQREASAGS